MRMPLETAHLYKRTNAFQPMTVTSGSGIWLTLENGQKILDATSGAGVSAIGHGDPRVKEAIVAQLDKIAYCHPGFYQSEPAQQLANFLVESTQGKMVRALLTGSGKRLFAFDRLVPHCFFANPVFGI
jgi:adenosylmethionine-8-amino-7-oxononanoate aminotransferase